MSQLETFLQLISETFEIEKTAIKDTLTPDDIEKWDSVTHMDLMAKFEASFKISFDMEELNEMQSIGLMKNILVKHGVQL